MGTLAPEVKRLTLSQRLNGKNGHQSCLPVRVFAIFCDVSRCKRCSAMSRNMYIFTRGTHIWKGRGCSWEILKNPWRRPTWAWANLFWPLKETILLQCSLVIDVIENFDRMNWVNKTNWLLNTYLRVQPWKRPLRLSLMTFTSEDLNWDQNRKFTPLSETTSIPAPFTRAKYKRKMLSHISRKQQF